jgi:lysophospholipase L1-like esterase
MSRKRKLLLATTFGFVLLIALFEGLARWAPSVVSFDEKTYSKLCAFSRGENPGLYQGYPHTIYRLKPQPGVNSLGFADLEWKRQSAPGVARIACLGASTTQDGVGNDRPSYPRQLADMLTRRVGCPIETLNFGIDGWTTAESMTNYFLNVVDHGPDVVVIQHALNDVWPRLWPEYANDYSHYRTPFRPLEFSTLDGHLFRWSRTYAAIRLANWGPNDLTSRNTRKIASRKKVLGAARLEPETMLGYEQNLRTIIDHATARGTGVLLMTIKTNPRGAEHIMKRQPELIAKLVEGTEQHNEVLRRIARETDAILVDVARAWDEEGFEEKHLPNYTDGFVHVNAAGNRNKALMVAEAILSAGLIDCE